MLGSNTQAIQTDCHCNVFNYCVDERCTCWGEVIKANGHTEQEQDMTQYSKQKQCCGGARQFKAHRY